MKQLLNNKFVKIILFILVVAGVYFLSEHTTLLDSNTPSEHTTFVDEANLPIYNKGTPVNFNIKWKDASFDSAIISVSDNKTTYRIGYKNGVCSTKLPAGKYTITNIELENPDYEFDIIGSEFIVSDSSSDENIKLVIKASFKFDFIRFLKKNFFFVFVLVIYLILYTQTNKNNILNKFNLMKEKINNSSGINFKE